MGTSKNIEVDTSKFDTMIAALIAEANGAPIVASVTTKPMGRNDPTKYWFVPEVGSRRGARPWPNPKKKTVLGNGGRVFSKQAPDGYIRRFNKQFAQFLITGYKKFVGSTLPTRPKLVQAANWAAAQARLVIRGAAPVDSGDLKNSIEVKEAK